MKRCPECRRDYFDDSLLYCLDDGTALLEGPASAEPETAILAPDRISSEQATQSFGPSFASGASSLPGANQTRSKRNSVIAGVVGLLLVTALGVGGYVYYNRVATTQIESIAVMPFVNESGNAEVEYLSDGMTETLISSLSQLPDTDVKPRSSVFRYKGKETDSQTIGKELNVQAILNGRLTQRGQDISLYVELVDAGRNKTIWSQTYNRKESDLVTLQADIARDVSGKLRNKLSGADEAKVTKSYTSDPKALELYLKGRYLSRNFTLDGFVRGIDAFHQAIAIDPNYALAYAGLSDAYFYASTIHLPPTEALPKVGEFAQKALAIDNTLAAAHHSTANFKANYERDNEGAKREFEDALKLDPNDSSIYFDYSQLLANIGEAEKSIAIARQGKQIDPQDSGISSTLAQALILAGRYDEGLAETENAIKLDNNNWWGHYWRGIALSEKGLHTDAVTAMRTAAGLDNSPLIRGVLAGVLARAGSRAECQHITDELILASKNKFVSQTSIAMGYVGLGDLDKAFEWLDKALASHDEQIVWIYKHPMFAGLRADPRYKEMLGKVNLH